VFDAGFLESFKAMLAVLIIFNRRRQGEVRRLTVTLYHNAAQFVCQTADVSCSLSPLEKHLLSLFYRVEIPGKRNRCVPLLMTG